MQGLAGGGNHSCAVVKGSVQCWGDNNFGQLGDSSTNNSDIPVVAQGLVGVQTLVAGHNHTCALANGGVQCWGDNVQGQLGIGSTTVQSWTPVAVQGLDGGVQALAAGYSHTCALVNGGAQCWGDNSTGALGTGTTIDSELPVAVEGLTAGVEALAAGEHFTCALVNGGVECWGSNSNGQLGNASPSGADAGSNVPVAVLGLDAGVQAIAAGASSACALVNGAIVCWGSNQAGQLGDDSFVDSPSPVPVSTLVSGLQAVVVGGGSGGTGHTCALVNGAVDCWGDDASGDLGINDTTGRIVPVTVDGLEGGVQLLTSGDFQNCALVNGDVWCWGANSDGQLGDSSFAAGLLPVPVAPWAP